MLLLWVGNLIAVALIAAYDRRSQEQEFPINIFLYARLAQAFGWFLFWLRNLIPDIYSVLLANGLVFTGMGLEALAIESINQKTRFRKSSYALTIPLIIIIDLAIYPFDSQNLRNGLGSLVPLACFIFPAILLTFEKGASPLQRLVGSFYLIYCASTAYRSVAAFTSSTTFTILTSNKAQTLAFLALFAFTMFGAIGYLLLFKERIDRELLLAATTDHLTNIYNRRSFFKYAETAIVFAMRNKEPVALLTIDIDKFKYINDAFGHPSGDLVLRDFATTTLQFVRPYDIFGRVGGDEFMILLPKTSASEAAKVVERIHEVAGKSGIGEKQIHYTVSIGVCSLIPQKTEDLEKMVQSSDIALYGAKAEGRDRISNGA